MLSLTAVSDVGVAVAAEGGIRLILTALRSHCLAPAVVAPCLGAVVNLVSRPECGTAAVVIAAGGIDTITVVLATNFSDATVVERGCSALRAITSAYAATPSRGTDSVPLTPASRVACIQALQDAVRRFPTAPGVTAHATTALANLGVTAVGGTSVGGSAAVCSGTPGVGSASAVPHVDSVGRGRAGSGGWSAGLPGPQSGAAPVGTDGACSSGGGVGRGGSTGSWGGGVASSVGAPVPATCGPIAREKSIAAAGSDAATGHHYSGTGLLGATVVVPFGPGPYPPPYSMPGPPTGFAIGGPWGATSVYPSTWVSTPGHWSVAPPGAGTADGNSTGVAPPVPPLVPVRSSSLVTAGGGRVAASASSSATAAVVPTATSAMTTTTATPSAASTSLLGSLGSWFGL